MKKTTIIFFSIIFTFCLLISSRVFADEIHDAISNGHIEQAKKLIAEKPKLINQKDKSGATPLSLALKKKDPALVLWLLEKGADYRVDELIDEYAFLDYKDFSKASILRASANQGWNNIIRFFGKQEKKLSETELTIMLMMAINADRLDTIDLLISMGANINSINFMSRTTPLISATIMNKTETAKHLVEKGARINLIEPATLLTPLKAAIERKNDILTDFYLTNGADVNSPLSNKRLYFKLFSTSTPLSIAVEQNNEPLVERLISMGAAPDIIDDQFRTPLNIAISNNYPKIAEMLLKKGADPNFYKTIDGSPPVLQVKDIATLKMLVDSGADIKAVDKDGRNLLHITDNYEITKYGIEKGIDINACDLKGETPLHYVSNPEIAELLLKNGANINALDNEGNTPIMKLFFSYRQDNRKPSRQSLVETAKFLLNNGTDVKIKNDIYLNILHEICSGNIGSEILTDSECAELIKIAVEKGADINASDLDGETPLLDALNENNYVKSVILLIGYGANINARNSDGQTPLHKCRSLTVAQALVEKGASLNTRDRYRNTPIMTSHDKNFIIIKYLVKKGADINAVNNKGQTLLFQLASVISPDVTNQQTTEFIKNLVELGADINKKDKDGQTVLFHSNIPKLTRFLLSKGLKANDKDIDGRNPLFYVNDENTRKILISAGADETIRDKDNKTWEKAALTRAGAYRITRNNDIVEAYQMKIKKIREQYMSSPFIKAINRGNISEIKRMLDKNPKLATKKYEVKIPYQADAQYLSFKETPLQTAIENGDTDIAALLIKYGAEVNPVEEGLTPLGLAVKRNMEDMVVILLNNGAKPTNYKIFPETYSPLTEAIEAHSDLIAQQLISHGADINSKDSDTPPIFAAVQRGNFEILELLLSKGANLNIQSRRGDDTVYSLSAYSEQFIKYLISRGWNVNKKDIEGNTILTRNVESGGFDSVRFLIANGADVNTLNKLGLTPLHYAKSPMIAKLLISAGADINALDNSGKSPAFCAGSPAMRDFFTSIGAAIPKKDKNNSTPLHYACFDSDYQMVNYYIQQGADVNAKDNKGRTPLHHIVKWGVCGGSSMSTNMLLENKANPNLADKEGMTPLHYTMIEDEEDKALIILAYGGNPNIKDKLGNTPLHYAAVLKGSNFIDPRILLEAGADPNIRNNKGETPADIARKSKNLNKGNFLRRLEQKAKKN
jgi:ankyrin repeat protein